MEILKQLATWIDGNVGVSSKALFLYFTMGKVPRPFDAPSDSNDRGRCIVLLNCVPEWIPRLTELEQMDIWGTRNGVKVWPWREQIPLIRQELGSGEAAQITREEPPPTPHMIKRGYMVRKPMRIGRKNGKRPKTRSKVPSISKLVKTADALFSASQRRIGANNEGIVACYTCGHKNHWKKMHNGHYLSRYYKAARWHKDNTRAQCVMCNLWKKGDTVVFRRNLINEIGEARVLAVEALRDAPIKLTREYLTSLIEQLKSDSLSTGG